MLDKRHATHKHRYNNGQKKNTHTHTHRDKSINLFEDSKIDSIGQMESIAYKVSVNVVHTVHRKMSFYFFGRKISIPSGRFIFKLTDHKNLVETL